MTIDAKPPPDEAAGKSEFESASTEEQPGFFRELGDFLFHHAAWWMIPIVVVLVLLGILLLLGSSAAAPFIYPLF